MQITGIYRHAYVRMRERWFFWGERYFGIWTSSITLAEPPSTKFIKYGIYVLVQTPVNTVVYKTCNLLTYDRPFD